MVACFWQLCFWMLCLDCMCTLQLCDWPSGFWSDALLKACGSNLISELKVIIFTIRICTHLLDFDRPSISVSLPSAYLSAICSSLALSPQWSYGFYLIHLQGKQGFQFFCKTEETKRKWMEQFDMAMWVWLHPNIINMGHTFFHLIYLLIIGGMTVDECLVQSVLLILN